MLVSRFAAQHRPTTGGGYGFGVPPTGGGSLLLAAVRLSWLQAVAEFVQHGVALVAVSGRAFLDFELSSAQAFYCYFVSGWCFGCCCSVGFDLCV